MCVKEWFGVTRGNRSPRDLRPLWIRGRHASDTLCCMAAASASRSLTLTGFGRSAKVLMIRLDAITIMSKGRDTSDDER